jgi:hypothetical protein
MVRFACVPIYKIVTKNSFHHHSGEANVGLGSLSSSSSANSVAQEFYARVGSEARASGVGISIISVRGAEIQLATVGQIATLSGGSISIADASALSDALAGVSSPTIGAKTVVTIRAAPGLSILL